MKTQNCQECQHFIDSVWRDDYDKPLKMLEGAKCTKGMKTRLVIFINAYPYSYAEYRRKCGMFTQK